MVKFNWETGSRPPVARQRETSLHPGELVVSPPAVLDHSVVDTHARCPRRAFYQYWWNRAPVGHNYPIELGNVYHKFRENIEVLYRAWRKRNPDGRIPQDVALDFFNNTAQPLLDGWVDPPIGHKKDWMTYDRVADTVKLGFKKWLEEKMVGAIEVLYTEQPFTLLLPFGEEYGGRIDQIVLWNGEPWIRDFKTTSRMGKTFSLKFDPANQFTGYTWAGRELSLQDVGGVIVEVVYNTKTTGPEIHQFVSSRASGHIEQWTYSMMQEFADIRRHEALTPRMSLSAWPMRTNACDDFGGCYFRQACQRESPAAIEQWLLANTVESHWDYTNPDAEEGLPE